MKNNSNARIYVKGVNLELNKIEFKTYPDVKKQVQIEATQGINLMDVFNEKIVFMVERAIEFEPQALFSLCVQVKVELYINENTLLNFENDLSKLEEYAKDKADILIKQSGVGNCLSLLIAQISSFGGGLPIVTPPDLKESE